MSRSQLQGALYVSLTEDGNGVLEALTSDGTLLYSATWGGSGPDSARAVSA